MRRVRKGSRVVIKTLGHHGKEGVVAWVRKGQAKVVFDYDPKIQWQSMPLYVPIEELEKKEV